MKQLQDESQKSRQTEQKFKKEVNQMKKQERLKDNQIKNLENEKKKRDVVLKRKLEEVQPTISFVAGCGECVKDDMKFLGLQPEWAIFMDVRRDFLHGANI